MKAPSLRRLGVAITLAILASAFHVSKMMGTTGQAVLAQGAQAGNNQSNAPFDQALALADLRNRIAGQENKPAGEVFKNIQMLKAMPAGRLLRVMEMGYSRSLGVSCDHCHVPNEWEKDGKPTKQIARDMAGMMANINNEQLKKIKNLKSGEPLVNCTTCHRGQTKPALNLPEGAPKQ